jgi:anti-sigma B factor antagonist
MNVPSAKMSVSVGDRCACVKIIGRANFTSSIDLRTLVDELLRKGYTHFVLELGECTLMDSTFLGVLAGFGLKINGPQGGSNGRTLELFNPTPRIEELLESLGVLHLFKITRGQVKATENAPALEVSHTPASREEITRTCLDAHELLMHLHPGNVSRFKDVARFLAEDLKKLKPES